MQGQHNLAHHPLNSRQHFLLKRLEAADHQLARMSSPGVQGALETLAKEVCKHCLQAWRCSLLSFTEFLGVLLHVTGPDACMSNLLTDCDVQVLAGGHLTMLQAVAEGVVGLRQMQPHTPLLVA